MFSWLRNGRGRQPALAAGATAVFVLVSVLGAFALASAGGEANLASPSPGEPLPGLTAVERQMYAKGRVAFETQRSVEQGLGPLFNELSCSRCHNRGGVGGAGFQVVALAGRSDGGKFDPLLAQGGPIVAQASVTSLRSEAQRLLPGCKLSPEGEPLPASANVVTRRRTTPLFGLGLVEATPEATFVALAERQPATVRGRLARPIGTISGRRELGRFGWKAQFSSLEEFAAAAFRNELGITNPLFQTEQLPSGNAAALAACDIAPELEDDGSAARGAADFMRLLAPVPALPLSAAAHAGDGLFSKLGCDTCHVRALETGQHPTLALSRQRYHPFSDFLLHDMGPRADGIGSDGDAAPNEMRTAPLWGLRLQTPDRWLHDGRARSLPDAIREHAGQGARAREAFVALGPVQQAELVAFLQTL